MPHRLFLAATLAAAAAPLAGEDLRREGDPAHRAAISESDWRLLRARWDGTRVLVPAAR